MSKVRAILSLGSNMGDKVANFISALEYVSEKCDIIQISPVYESVSLLKDGQENYYNIIAVIATDMEPIDLLSFTQSVETRMGRIRKGIWLERNIDIDIVDYNSIVFSSPILEIPHYGTSTRSFVLYPLRDVLPEYSHPKTNIPIDDMIKGIEDSLDIKKLDITIDFK